MCLCVYVYVRNEEGWVRKGRREKKYAASHIERDEEGAQAIGKSRCL